MKFPIISDGVICSLKGVEPIKPLCSHSKHPYLLVSTVFQATVSLVLLPECLIIMWQPSPRPHNLVPYAPPPPRAAVNFTMVTYSEINIQYIILHRTII